MPETVTREHEHDLLPRTGRNTATAFAPAVRIALVGALALALPLLLTDQVWQAIIVLTLTDAMIVLGLSLLFGFAGQISLAQSAFAGVGAYSVAIGTTRWGWDPWLGLPVGMVLAGLLAYVIGRPILRLHGLYLAMATIALNTIFVIVAGEMRDYTGGPFGLAGLEPLSILRYEFYEPADMYYLAMVAFVILAVVARLLLRSSFGLQLQAIRDNERAASLSGIDVSRLKVKVFVTSAVFASVGGFFKAEYLLIVTPSQFSIVASIYVVVMLVVGGSTSIWGVMAGALFINAVPELVDASEVVEPIVFAATFMGILMFLPDGLAPWIGGRFDRTLRWWRAR